MKKNKKGGFTLLELLIVIAILAILSVALVIVLNPAETLKKARDAQRISDLSTMKTAIGLYTTSTSSPTLGSTDDTPATDIARGSNFSNTACQTTVGTFSLTTGRIWYSLPGLAAGLGDISDPTIAGVTFDATHGATQSAPSFAALADGSGWIPVKFSSLTGGSPISNLPMDPTNSVTTGTSLATAMTADALVYRYSCESTNLTYEIDATLESAAYTTAPDDKRTSDGGNSTFMYEVGTNLQILPINSNLAANAAGF
jgi:prepilin-type N-terminal cleavage/methylation domain-containing protein